jgi:predicted nucleotidyltransferase component of viral defense system
VIDQQEIKARARRLGLQPDHVAKDYVLTHLLAAIAEENAFLVFRGGTALARIYWPDFRLSEDLDFITSAVGSGVDTALRVALQIAADRTGTELIIEIPRLRDGWNRCEVGWDEGVVRLDVNIGDRAALPVRYGVLDLPYSDLSDGPWKMEVVALEEILANKWYMLDDREEPRDLFDLWFGVCIKGVPLEHIGEAFRAKYGGKPGLWRVEKARRLEKSWDERLGHQVRDLPRFEEVITAVLAKVREWEEG